MIEQVAPPIIFVLAAWVVIGLAFLPTIVAVFRKHPDAVWIFVLSLIGPLWILALIWAFRSDWLIAELFERMFPSK